jgi:hypothetical protein
LVMWPAKQGRADRNACHGEQDDRSEVPQQVMSGGVVGAHELRPERAHAQAGKSCTCWPPIPTPGYEVALPYLASLAALVAGGSGALSIDGLRMPRQQLGRRGD